MYYVVYDGYSVSQQRVFLLYSAARRGGKAGEEEESSKRVRTAKVEIQSCRSCFWAVCGGSHGGACKYPC